MTTSEIIIQEIEMVRRSPRYGQHQVLYNIIDVATWLKM